MMGRLWRWLYHVEVHAACCRKLGHADLHWQPKRSSFDTLPEHRWMWALFVC